ncbi:MAG: RNA-dependent RNA polymerase [Wufeng shrew rhabdovirus 7]|nr:MAG: RNA-dependent RNA polymerase [Wufeng shrew rhabdovirus 7]
MVTKDVTDFSKSSTFTRILKDCNHSTCFKEIPIIRKLYAQSTYSTPFRFVKERDTMADLTLPDIYKHIPADKTFFDFHLRKPILPKTREICQNLRINLRERIDNDLEGLKGLVDHYYETEDPGRMIGQFLSDVPFLDTSKMKSCIPSIPINILNIHTDIMAKTFGRQTAADYNRRMTALNSDDNQPNEVKTLKLISLSFQAAVTWRNVKNYHSRSVDNKIPYWRKHPHLKLFRIQNQAQVLKMEFRSREGNRYDFIVGHHWTVMVYPQEQTYVMLSHDQLLMIQDVLLSRWLTLKILSAFAPPMIPAAPSTRELLRIYRAGDEILKVAGNEGYNLIKYLEPICIGLTQKELDESLGDDQGGAFLSEIVQDYYKTASESYSGCEAEEFYNSLKEIRQTEALIQCYGLFRHWGHPVVKPLTGLNKLRIRGNSLRWVDTDFVNSLADDLNKQLIVKYFQKHQTWPEGSRIAPSISPVLAHCIQENRLPTIRESLSIKNKWRFVHYDRIFEVPEKIPIGMILEDKAHSRTRTELLEILNRKKTERVTRRLIITALETENLDIRALLDEIDKNGLDEDDLIIGLKAKERELKVEGRFFSLMTLALRMYFVSTEWLIAKHIIPIFPEITMGDTFIDLQKKIFNVTKNQKVSERKAVNFVISLDYEKWNAHQRSESTSPVFEILDRAFGWTSVISRTHEIFENCIIYYADYQEIIPRDLKEHHPICWHGHKGGMEGLRQKGWTVIGILLFRRVTQEHTVDMKMLAQGDNQVFSLLYQIPPSTDDKQYVSEIQRLRKKTESILSEVIVKSNMLGLPVKKEETWISRSVFLYGKTPVINGAIKSSIVKIISRLYMTTNDLAPTLQNTLSSLLTSSLTLTQQINSTLPGIVLFHWYGWELISLGMDLNVLLGEPLFALLNLKLKNKFRINLGETWRPTGDDIQTRLLLDLLYRDSVLGGMGGSNLYRWVVRQFPDPLSESLSFVENVLSQSDYGVVRLMGARFKEPILEDGNDRFASLIQDPTSIPVKGSSKSVNIIKNLVFRYLDNATWVKNKVIQEALQIRKVETDRLKEGLREIKPCFPRFLSELWNSTVVGRGEYYLGKIVSTTSLVQLSRTRGKMALTQKLKQAERSLVKTWVTQAMIYCGEPESFCSTRLSQQLRDEGWGREIVGATVPHPSSQWVLSPAPRDECDYCHASDSYFREHITIYVNPELSKNPNYLSKPGCFVPYLGSTTSEESSTSPYGMLTTDEPLMRNAVHLLRSISWIIDPGSQMHETIKNLLRSLTDAFGSGFPESEQVRSGSGCHRFQSERVGGGAFPGISFTGLSHFCFNSNNLDLLGRGEENFAILFQAVISFFMVKLATLASCNTYLHHAYHIHPKCKDCLVPIKELKLSIDSPIEFPSLPSSQEFFLPGDKLDIYELPRMSLSREEFDNETDENKMISCSVGLLISAIIQASSTSPRNDSSDVLNLSYFRAINPSQFGNGLVTSLLILEIMTQVRQGRVWKYNREMLVDSLVQGALEYVNRPGIFSKLTMVFLIPEYWEYCIENSFIGGVSFPLTHQDGESILRTWAFSNLEDKCLVWASLCYLSTQSLWIFYDLNTFRLVTNYHIAGVVANALVSSTAVPTSLREDLRKLDRSYPPRVKFGTPPLQVSLATGDKVSLRYTPYTLKNAIKSIARNSTVYANSRLKAWRCNAVANPHWIWDSETPNRQRAQMLPDTSQELFYQSIAIHSCRLVCRLTTTHMKIAPILTTLTLDDGLLYSIGDGSGGIASYLLGRYQNSFVIFNTLIDHHDEILQSTGTVVPPAIYLLPKEARNRMLNSVDCMSGNSDLTKGETLCELSNYISLKGEGVRLVICDAEPISDYDFLLIYRNIRDFVQLYTPDPETWVVMKLHLKLEVSWKILAEASNLWARVRLMRSDFSRYGSSEVYMCLQGWGCGEWGDRVTPHRDLIMSEMRQYNPPSEYKYLRRVKYSVCWGSASPQDMSRTKRILSKVSFLCGLHLTHPRNLDPLPVEAFSYILSMYWEVILLTGQHEVMIPQAQVQKRISVCVGFEILLALLFGAREWFTKRTTLDWSNLNVSIVGRGGHRILSLSDKDVIWNVNCSAERHLAADALRSASAWIRQRDSSLADSREDLKVWCMNSQIYRYLLTLSRKEGGLFIDLPVFNYYTSLDLSDLVD